MNYSTMNRSKTKAQNDHSSVEPIVTAKCKRKCKVDPDNAELASDRDVRNDLEPSKKRNAIRYDVKENIWGVHEENTIEKPGFRGTLR